jgi:Methyltransferase domain
LVGAVAVLTTRAALYNAIYTARRLTARPGAPREIFIPDLNTTLHLDMLHDFRSASIPLAHAARRGYATRRTLEQAISKGELTAEVRENGVRLLKLDDLERLYGRPSGGIYGLEWGDPDWFGPLRFIKDRYLLPLLSAELVGVEIGPGGGRWTQYLQRIKRLYAVDFHQELLDELKRNFNRPNIIPIKNNGDDFPGISDNEVDFVFSLGVFVHLDLPIIEAYLNNMKRIMKPGATAFIDYSDKQKIMARVNWGFSENSPETMRRLLADLGYVITLEDTTTMWHSGIVVFQKPN